MIEELKESYNECKGNMEYDNYDIGNKINEIIRFINKVGEENVKK